MSLLHSTLIVYCTCLHACGGVDVANCQTRSQESEHKEWLCAGLVLDIILDGVRDEVLVLEEDLQAQP